MSHSCNHNRPQQHLRPLHTASTTPCVGRPTVSLRQLRHQLLTTTTTTSPPDPDPDFDPNSDQNTMSSVDQHDIHDDDLDSLPSISSGVLSSDTADSADAQREWEESLEQVQLLLTMVLVPFAGKYLGRKFAYWSRSSFLPSVTAGGVGGGGAGHETLTMSD